ncbi:uncharacterized protein LOC131620113 [Vicia villosa]|uniref:uncharacterized protein LOC131620113 n=1 Tax=Vicia villosa TaxID=3911 RepID=UPI00273C66CC|nr:uncharacterized protein LOC131620113 [Vicia villosa]
MEGGGAHREEGWSRVPRRHFRNWVPHRDVFPVGKKLVGDVVSFYISEFLESSKAEDLFVLFGCIGNAVEVAIAPRRNKIGKRFGFARFSDVEDARWLGVKLDNVAFEGKKIHANVPRYERKSAGGAKPLLQGIFHQGLQLRGAGSGSHNRVWGEARVDGRSFVEALNKPNSREGLVPNLKSVAHVSSEEVRGRFAKAWIGVLRYPGSSHGIQKSIEKAGFFGIVISPLGAKKCLVEESDNGALSEFLGEEEGWWKEWFVEVVKWNVEALDASRAVWLRVFGIPCVGWNSEVFSSIANLFGSFISVDDSTASGRSFEAARIQVCIDLNCSIPDSVNLVLDGKAFSLFIKEELLPQQYLYREQHHSDLSVSSESINSEDFGSGGDMSCSKVGSSIDSRDSIEEGIQKGSGEYRRCRE